MKLLERLDRIATTMISLCVLIVFASGFYVLFLEKSYLSYPKMPFPVQVATLRPGDFIPMEITRCNSDKIDHSYNVARAIREVHTGKIVPMDPFYSLIPAGCSTALPSRVHRVPLDTEPGRYEFYGGAETHGIVRIFDVIFRSQQFDVLPALPAVSLQGPAGPPGADGPTGKTGATGKAGEAGKSGATGATGAKGSFWGGK